MDVKIKEIHEAFDKAYFIPGSLSINEMITFKSVY